MSTSLETIDGSCKFYRVEVKGLKTIVTHGKVGSDGQTLEETHASASKASTYAENLVDKLQGNGYQKTNNKRKREVDDGPRKSARLALSRAAKDKAIAAMTAPTSAASKKAPKQKSIKKRTSSKKSTNKPSTTKKVTKKATNAKKAATKKANTTKKTPENTETPTAGEASTAPAKKTSKRATKKNRDTAFTPQKKATPTHHVPSVTAAKPTIEKSPVPKEWEVTLPVLGYGIYVNDTHVYAGDEDGLVQQFDKSGVVQKQYRLPSGVKCIVGDGIFLYVGTNDGSLYDITTGVPRLLSKIEAFSQVYWMDVRHGRIAASDNSGKVALINTEGETIWIHAEPGSANGWMCAIDDTGVYHGDVFGVHKRELTKGDKIWDSTTIQPVMFGQQDQHYVYATSRTSAAKLNKENGKLEVTYDSGGISMGVSKDSKMIVTADPLTIYNSDGSRVQQFATSAGYEAPASIATWGEHECYGIRSTLVKYNLSPENVAKGKTGMWKTTSFTAQSLAEVMPETSVEVTSDTSGGIVCECVKEDDKLRIRVISPGYNTSWNVQFPRAIREEGAKFVVEKIEAQEGFYRAWGDIKRVQS